MWATGLWYFTYISLPFDAIKTSQEVKLTSMASGPACLLFCYKYGRTASKGLLCTSPAICCVLTFISQETVLRGVIQVLYQCPKLKNMRRLTLQAFYFIYLKFSNSNVLYSTVTIKYICILQYIELDYTMNILHFITDWLMNLDVNCAII